MPTCGKFLWFCLFFSKNNFVLFAHVSCPSKIVSIVTILCLFFQKKSETQKLKRTKFTYDFGNYFLSLKHFEHFFFELFLPPIIFVSPLVKIQSVNFDVCLHLRKKRAKQRNVRTESSECDIVAVPHFCLQHFLLHLLFRWLCFQKQWQLYINNNN